MKLFARIGIPAVLVALAMLASPSATRAQNGRDCAWPIELSPEGFGNWLGPESLARYWVMPLNNYDSVALKGTYPHARYFSLVVYDTNNGTPTGVVHSLYDAEIAPDQGSNNPFVNPGAGNGTYTVTIAHNGQASGNTMGFSSEVAWVLLRVYEPEADPALSGQSLTGGVPLPAITVTSGGASQELEACSPVNKLPDVTASLPLFFPPGLDILGHEGTPSSDRLWFAPPTAPPPVLLPNPDNKYIAMFPGDAYQPGRIIVIHGKAPTTPGTFHGAQILTPARGSQTADVRFWSLCIDDLAIPVPAVGCTADLTTKVEGGYYTIVISDDLLRPDWLKPNVNWLPWGDEQYSKLVFMRNLLPAANFSYSIQKAIEAPCTFDFNFPTLPDRGPVDTAGQCAQQVMGDYYPVAVWCDKSTFIASGVRACLKQWWKPGVE
ncbi:MAG TPA: hypothetical protein VNJ12_12480 [Candidatus Dormibacteraeota bacterium]|nr:hypothetical protein [Candidatus Dormibacteraeota bacterium]